LLSICYFLFPLFWFVWFLGFFLPLCSPILIKCRVDLLCCAFDVFDGFGRFLFVYWYVVVYVTALKLLN
jgi:hypothetical protein